MQGNRMLLCLTTETVICQKNDEEQMVNCFQRNYQTPAGPPHQFVGPGEICSGGPMTSLFLS